MDDGTARIWLVDSARLAGEEVGACEWFIPIERRDWPIRWNSDDLAGMESEDGVVAPADEEREFFITDRTRALAEFEDAEVRVFRADLDDH